MQITNSHPDLHLNWWVSGMCMQGLGIMKRLPFSIFKRSNSRSYYVKFRNEETGMYLPAISTKQESESEAVKTAFDWLKNGIPRRSEPIPLKQYSLRNMAKATEVSKEDATFICKELQRRGLLKSVVLTDSKQDRDFAEFLTNFWNYDNSPYPK